jgi:hypothetical protein
MRYFFSITLLLTILSCQNKGPGQKDAPAETIFFDYRIWGEEGREEATLRLQYRWGEEGDAFAWRPPAKVLFDGGELKADSTRFTGPYYEVIKPVEELSGDHYISFVDSSGKERRDSFRFEPFSLATEMPSRQTFQMSQALCAW